MGLHPTPYPEVNSVLLELAARVGHILGENLVGVYLHGSLAVGDFDEKDSDVDFLVVTNRDLSTEEVARLQAMHGAIHDLDSPWAKHLEGSYLPRPLLSQPDQVGIKPLWYLGNCWRDLAQSVHDNAWVVFWTLHHHGIAVVGPGPESLFAPVPPERLKREILGVINDWGGSMLKNPAEISSVWHQSFTVLTYCRMLQTLGTVEIRSKLAAVLWSERALDKCWAGLIQRAWRERPNPSLKIRQPPDAAEVRLTLEFIRYAMDEAAKFAQ
jgi:hypothetical protein